MCNRLRQAESLGEERDAEATPTGAGARQSAPVHIIILLSKLLFCFLPFASASHLLLEHFSDLEHEMK